MPRPEIGVKGFIRFLLLVLIFTSAVGFSDPLQSQPSQGFQEFVYATVGGTPLWLDFLPATDGSLGPHPLIIFIHGGAWQSGVRQAVPGPILGFRNEGFSIATIDYRLTSQAGEFGNEPVTWPAQRDDAKAAVRWLRAHANDLNIRPDAFVAWGLSAGGHLSAILALTNDSPGSEGSVGDWTQVSSAVQLGVNFYGPSDLLRLDLDVTTPPGSTLNHEEPGSPESLLLRWQETGISMGEILDNEDSNQAPWQELVELAHDASPIFAVQTAHAVPLMIAHGTMDTVIAYPQSVRLHDTLTSLGLVSTLETVAGAGHGLPPSSFFMARDWILEQWQQPAFIRGDTNQDNSTDLADVIVILSALFQGGQGVPDCGLAQDVNDDDSLDISDAVYMLSWLFSNSAPIPAPHPLCGTQAVPGNLDCLSPPVCP